MALPTTSMQADSFDVSSHIPDACWLIYVFIVIIIIIIVCYCYCYCKPAALSTAMVQADPTNVRAATRAATCHIKMGQLTEATAVLEAVKATVPAGHPVPSDLASKQSDLELTKRMVTEVLLLHVTAGSTICADPSVPADLTSKHGNL